MNTRAMKAMKRAIAGMAIPKTFDAGAQAKPRAGESHSRFVTRA
jgi:hypothetical protein